MMFCIIAEIFDFDDKFFSCKWRCSLYCMSGNRCNWSSPRGAVLIRTNISAISVVWRKEEL